MLLVEVPRRLPFFENAKAAILVLRLTRLAFCLICSMSVGFMCGFFAICQKSFLSLNVSHSSTITKSTLMSRAVFSKVFFNADLILSAANDVNICHAEHLSEAFSGYVWSLGNNVCCIGANGLRQWLYAAICSLEPNLVVYLKVFHFLPKSMILADRRDIVKSATSPRE